MFLQYLIVGCLFLTQACGAAWDDPVSSGFLQGHLKIISVRTVELADGSAPAVTPQTYIDYPLVVLSSDGKQEVAVITADAKGNYRVALPPGAYLLDVQDRVRKHVRAKPVPFTVISQETAHLDFEMDTGIR